MVAYGTLNNSHQVSMHPTGCHESSLMREGNSGTDNTTTNTTGTGFKILLTTAVIDNFIN